MLAGAFLQLHNQHMSRLLLFAKSAASLQRKLIFGLLRRRPFRFTLGA